MMNPTGGSSSHWTCECGWETHAIPYSPLKTLKRGAVGMPLPHEKRRVSSCAGRAGKLRMIDDRRRPNRRITAVGLIFAAIVPVPAHDPAPVIRIGMAGPAPTPRVEIMEMLPLRCSNDPRAEVLSRAAFARGISHRGAA
jgi:hypothetical protein